MQCGSCHDNMHVLTLRSHLNVAVDIDVCWHCHLIWFDHMESTSLSPGSVIDLFRQIHNARNEARQMVALHSECPKCNTTLRPASDITKSGKFSFFRCEKGHGRLISFSQFLREKHFVRTLQPKEIASLAIKIKQIRCSSCGGPIDLTKDSACTHCAAPIAALDEGAVEKALITLDDKERQRGPLPPAQLGEAILANAELARRHRRAAAEPEHWLTRPTTGGIVDLVDIVDAGIGAILSAWRH